MKIEVKRIFFGENFTIGEMYIDGEKKCYTLEDKVRQIDGEPVANWKVFGETAIPTGAYPVTITFSNHFQKNLPQICNVEGFEGVRIHPGNSDKDTEGCILVADTWDGKSDWVGGSVNAFNRIFPSIQAAAEDGITIDVNNAG